MVGYSKEQNGYRIYNPQMKNVVISKHVGFDEADFQFEEPIQELEHESIVYIYEDEVNSPKERMEVDDSHEEDYESLEDA